MRVLTYVLCGLCLAGGAVTSLAMTQLSPAADDRPSVTAPARSEEPARVRDADFFLRADEPLLKDNEPEPFGQEVSDPFGTDPGVRGPNRPSQFSDSNNPAAVGNMPSRRGYVMRPVRETVVRYVAQVASAEEQAAARELQDAITSLKDSSDPEAQKKATDTIQQQLSEQFDLDLKQREKELAEVEAKVKSLREKLDKRKAAREDIISLRLKTITNDAAGLGFPGGGGASEAVESEFPALPGASGGGYSNEVRVYSTSPQPVYPAAALDLAPKKKPPITVPGSLALPPGDPLN